MWTSIVGIVHSVDKTSALIKLHAGFFVKNISELQQDQRFVLAFALCYLCAVGQVQEQIEPIEIESE